MRSIGVKVNVQQAIEDIKREFAHLSQSVINKSAARALNYTAEKSRVNIAREMRSMYNMGVSDSKSQIKASKANEKKLFAEIAASAYFTGLDSFKPKQVVKMALASSSVKLKGKKGSRTLQRNRLGRKPKNYGVYVEIYRGKSVFIPSAFIVESKRWGPIIMARGKYTDGTGLNFAFRKQRSTTGSDLPLGYLKTVSPYGGMKNKELTANKSTTLQNVFITRFKHELTQGHTYGKR